ncbi:hypothetical protein BMR85_009930 [Achromobacter sp. KAs 3-5]|nr:hypothetical protein BMR85_009930 [Achromobacter sp. KAs 3-5]
MAQPQTLAQKLIAAACGRETVAEGEIVTCAVDLAMFHDSSGPRRLQPMLQELGATLWDPSRIVLVIDHYVPESDDESRRIVRIARDWAAEQQLPNVYDSVGICHVVVPQHGHIRPGMFCVGGDSHSPTGGAFGAYMFGIGSTEMLGVAVTGQIWVKVPKTLMMHWRGQLAAGVTAKDMMLHMIGRYGMNGGRYQAVEFCGEAVRALSMQERMTLSNMSAELGSQVGLIAPDETTAAYLREAGVTADLDLARWQSDPQADAEWHEFDANFGIGSSREQAAAALVRLGVAAVIAPSFNGLYFRNAFNVGLLLLTCSQADTLAEGEGITFDPAAGRIGRPGGTPAELHCEPVPGFLLDMVQAGGLLNLLKQRQTS